MHGLQSDNFYSYDRTSTYIKIEILVIIFSFLVDGFSFYRISRFFSLISTICKACITLVEEKDGMYVPRVNLRYITITESVGIETSLIYTLKIYFYYLILFCLLNYIINLFCFVIKAILFYFVC